MGAAESVASVGLQLGIRACFTTIRPLVILGVFLKIVLVNMKAEHLGPSELGVPLRPRAPGSQDFGRNKNKTYFINKTFFNFNFPHPIRFLDLPTALILR